ncbi:MAG: DNA mismatch repair endonuclease MutL [Candidatus Promineifilaceae bacterium]
MPIRVLPDQLASQIAAGEVVERPASVVKELVENALDAGARAIRIEVRQGGRQLVQVADDGAGIHPQELELAFQRHATSKLESAEGLNAIHSLGFRGEALAAIAAVSQLTAVSRPAGEAAGLRLAFEGGKLRGQETVGAPQGTLISVANLFYNLPARLKFLKSIPTERRLIDETVSRYALAYPEVRFRLTHDNRVTFQSAGSGDRRESLAAVYGPEVARELLELVEGPAGPAPADEAERWAGLEVSGFVSPPGRHYANRSHISLFVNGRWVRDNQLAYAIIQAYHTLLPAGRYPLAALFLRLPAADVDVNVHPAKTEVRFRRGEAPFGAVQRAVRQTLLAAGATPHIAALGMPAGAGWGPGQVEAASALARPPALNLSWPLPATAIRGQEEDATERPQPALTAAGLPILRVVGQVGAAYIIAEGPAGLYLIDQHAAHERVLYEQFMAEREAEGRPAAQALVSPAVAHLSPPQARLLEGHLELLGRLGFEVEPFGANAFVVRSVPALLALLEPGRALLDVVEELERGAAPLQAALEAQIALRVCKSAAVKAGRSLSPTEMEALVRQLERCDNPHTCPHGRPTLIHLSAAQLAREFGRS